MLAVIVKCVGCGNKKEYKDDEVPHHQPFCEYCGSPLIAEQVELETRKRKSGRGVRVPHKRHYIVKYIYHYHAIYQRNPSSLEHSDGIIISDGPINSNSRYQTTKKNISKQMVVADSNHERVIIQSLTLLHTVADEAGHQPE